MTTHEPPRLSPAAPALIQRFEIAREAMQAAVTESYFQRHPPESEEQRAYLARRCREDLTSHLDQAQVALQLGEPPIFAAYLRWLRDVFASRGMSIDHTAEALSTLGTWVGGHLDHPASSDVATLLDYGVTVLNDPEASRDDRLLMVPAPTPPVRQMTDSLLDGKRSGVDQQLLALMAEGAALVDVSVDLVQPALYRVGELWQQNRITVAQEHLATAIAQSALATAFAASELSDPNDRKAAFACVEGNLHAVGLRMVSDAFEVEGWDVDFLGADVPSAAVIAHCDATRPELVGLSVSMPQQIPTVRSLITQLRAELGATAPSVIVGGLTVNQLGSALRGLGADACFADARDAIRAARN